MALRGTGPQPTFPFGGGGAVVGVGGLYDVITTAVATGANTDETTLASKVIPANTLNTDKDTIRGEIFWKTAANANAKTFTLYLGGTGGATIFTETGNHNNKHFSLKFRITRTGVAGQDSSYIFEVGGVSGGTLVDTDNTATQDEATALNLLFTGQNGVAAANDIVFESWYIYLERPGS